VIERHDELEALRAEISAMRERIGRIEALLLGLYGPGALGDLKPPPAAPQPAPPRPTRAIATMFSRR
jgi:hypothetical protein